MIKIGLLGVGHLGKIHLKCLQNTPFEFVGFYDPIPETAHKVSEEFGFKFYENPDELIVACDAIDIVSTTNTHFELCHKVLSAGKHVFVEKPFVKDLEEAKILTDMVNNSQLKFQIGHVERYNPAYKQVADLKLQPKFIEGHRLAQFNPRGNDVSVVLDLMIHDLDLILQLNQSPVKTIQANGVSVVSDTPDICNARIEFESGSVVNLTASRISLKNMRKLRIFQQDAYISLDFLNKETQIIKLEELSDGSVKDENGIYIETNQGPKRIVIEQADVTPNNAIEDELNDFYQSIHTNTPTKVNIQDGYRSLKVAYDIMRCVEQNAQAN